MNTREEIIKKAQELLACGALSKEACDAIKADFPELAENDDERIRKDLIRFLEVEKEDRDSPFFDIAIAYLEKQKKRKMCEDLLSFIESLEKEQPQGLDEAAEESSEKTYPYKEADIVYDKQLVNEAREYHIAGFKACAKWMAEQFQEIREGKLVDWYETNGVDYCSGVKTTDSFEVPEGFYIKRKVTR